jgi:hypothetical protein
MFHQCDILSMWHFVNVTFGQCDILSKSHFVNVTFCQSHILSKSHFVNVTFCQYDVSSMWCLSPNCDCKFGVCPKFVIKLFSTNAISFSCMFTHFLIFFTSLYFLITLNHSWHHAVCLWITILTCVTINQYRTGLESVELNIDKNKLNHQMSLIKSKCWYSNNC